MREVSHNVRRLRHGLLMLAAGLLYGAGINVFIQPNRIAVGGVTGITLLLHHLWEVPVGVSMLALNIPLFLAAWRVLGRTFLFGTMAATTLLSLLVDATARVLPAYEGDLLLCALFGGGLVGTALGLVFMTGATTGGTDILAWLLRLRFPHLSLGRLMLLTDAVVVGVSALVYREPETVLYAVVTMTATSVFVDKLLGGVDAAQLAIIITTQTETVASALTEEVGRGVTVIKARGWYSGAERDMLYCVVKPYDVAALKEIVRRCDGDAFLVFAHVTETLGEGFKPLGPPSGKRKEDRT